MTAQKGRDLLLKIDATGTGSFQTVAGLRSNAITFNAETVDVSHQESAGQWRELVARPPACSLQRGNVGDGVYGTLRFDLLHTACRT